MAQSSVMVPVLAALMVYLLVKQKVERMELSLAAWMGGMISLENEMAHLMG